MIDKNFLESVGVTDEETVNKIVAEYGNDIKAEKDAAETLKTQLSEANTQIESFKGMDIDKIKKSAEDWEAKFKQSEADRAAFEHKTKVGSLVKELKLKDSIYEDYLVNQLIEKELKFDNGKLIGSDDVINAFKESHPDAFQSEPVPPKFSYKVNGENGSTGMSGVEAAFMARNPGLKID